jgi:hypothetical protein
MKDLMNRIHPVMVLAPNAAITDNTAKVGAIVDRKNFESLTYVLLTGTDADADAAFTVLLEESDDSGMSGAVAVDDADLIGTEVLAAYNFADDGEPRKLGYKGNKRYTRLTVTPANNTGNFFLAAVAIMGHPQLKPTANPPI